MEAPGNAARRFLPRLLDRPATPQKERWPLMLPAPSTSTAAPRGKRCTMCLCCDAVIEFAGELLCAACDDGTHPPPAEQRPAAGATVCGASTAAPATLEAIREMATAAAPAQPQPKGATVSTPSKNKPGTRITPETRRAILAAPPDESNGAVARRLGISDGSVWLIRKRAGIKSKAKSGIRPLSIPAETKPEPAPDTALPITMTVTERTLDAWWRGLPIRDKGAIFSGNYVIAVEESVR
jgi:hypothetical protein